MTQAAVAEVSYLAWSELDVQENSDHQVQSMLEKLYEANGLQEAQQMKGQSGGGTSLQLEERSCGVEPGNHRHSWELAAREASLLAEAGPAKFMNWRCVIARGRFWREKRHS